MKELPEYFTIRQDSTNPLWLKYIKWLNKTFKTNWGGDNYRSLYGYDGGLEFNGTQSFSSIRSFKNNPVEMTLVVWDEIVNKQEDQKRKWRADFKCIYWCVSTAGELNEVMEYNHDIDDLRFNFGNYFKTKEEAKEVSEKIKALLNEHH